MKELLLGILGFCSAGVGIVLVFFNKFSKRELFNVKEVEILKIEDVIIFFKKKEIIEKLKSDSNLLAVAIKEQVKDKYNIVLTLYDKSTDEVLNIDNCAYALKFKAKDIDIDLKNAFGDKDMIVLN